MTLRKRLLLALWALSAAACDGDAAPDGGLVLIDATTVRPDVGPPPEGATHFLVRIENVAGPALPSALGAGAWTLHTDADPLFTEGERDRGLGLEALAEDGDPSALAAHLDPGGTFRATAPGALTELIVTARPERPRLSLAAGLRESNDVIVATSGDGIALFDPEGQPLPARDVTAELHLFNVGTEIDQAPGLGPDQGARQAAPNTGAREGLPRPFSDSTRALPRARGRGSWTPWGRSSAWIRAWRRRGRRWTSSAETTRSAPSGRGASSGGRPPWGTRWGCPRRCRGRSA